VRLGDFARVGRAILRGHSGTLAHATALEPGERSSRCRPRLLTAGSGTSGANHKLERSRPAFRG
jgi:hypothetical protein